MDERADDIAADERAFGLPRGSIQQIRDACDDFFRRRGMAPGRPGRTFLYGRRPVIASVVPLTTPQSTPTPTIITMPDETAAPTEATLPNDNDVFTLIDVAFAANALVNAALSLDGKAPLTKAAVDLVASLRTAQAAGLIEPD